MSVFSWRFEHTASGFSWQRSLLTFSEVLICCVYPFYCQLGSHIHKAMIGYPYPLREDTEMTNNKGWRCLNGEWERVYWNKKEEKKVEKDGDLENDSKWSRGEGFVLHFPDLAPEPWVFLSSEERISFPFISFLFRPVGYLYTDWCGCWRLSGELWRASH